MQVSVCPGGLATGYTYFIPQESHLESQVVTRGYLEGRMTVGMAGRCPHLFFTLLSLFLFLCYKATPACDAAYILDLVWWAEPWNEGLIRRKVGVLPGKRGGHGGGAQGTLKILTLFAGRACVPGLLYTSQQRWRLLNCAVVSPGPDSILLGSSSCRIGLISTSPYVLITTNRCADHY